MKNTLNFLLVIGIMVFIIGCNCKFGDQTEPTSSKPNQPTSTPNSNKSLTDQATDVATQGEKIGIQECDELMDYFRNKIENDNTDMITKAILKTLEGQFRDGIKKSIEENKTNKEETAKFCKEFKKNLDEQDAKKQQ